MDRLESLSNTLSQITMYDVKSMYNQAKNMVLNVSEMEAKVREATNDDPWGASSTLMQEIAQGTFSFQYFNEIMPCIYARFMEKEARQWRQIYKALQLLEYLIKHGSERVVDDTRSHISTLKMLRNFHYIDDKGKDEGLNVRNRSKELVELLSDVEKIRSERRKAKTNKSKYFGVGNDGYSGGSMSFNSGGGRYGGFGSDSFNGSSSYSNDHGSYGGSSSGRGGFSDSRRGYEEYNAGDDEDVSQNPAGASSRPTSSVRSASRKSTAPTPAQPPAAPAPTPVEDLLGSFGDDETSNASGLNSASNALSSLATNKALPVVSNKSINIDDDDFSDFQAAPVQAQPVALSSGATKPNLMQMLNAAPARPTGFTQQGGFGMTGTTMGAMHRPSSSVSSPPSQFASPVQSQAPNLFGNMTAMKPTTPVYMQPTSSTMKSNVTSTPHAVKPSGGNFDDLWSMSLGNQAKPAANNNSKSIKDLEKEKATAGLWGGQKSPQSASFGTQNFGAFGNKPSGAQSSSGDDLLL